MIRDVDPRLETDVNLCRSCMYGFPESVGYSCGISREKLCRDVVTGCTCYKESVTKRRGGEGGLYDSSEKAAFR